MMVAAIESVRPSLVDKVPRHRAWIWTGAMLGVEGAPPPHAMPKAAALRRRIVREVM
jgi:hypothetical protein